MFKKKLILHNEQAGNLDNLISDTEKMQVTHLKISGFLNSKDFDVLDEMCTSEVRFDDNDNATVNLHEPPFLTILDLGDCLLTDNEYLGEFTYYSKLEKFVCPKNLKGTGNMNIFENSTFLKTVEIPEGFIEFGSRTFLNCKNLENINFPNSLEKIGDFSFCGCLLKNIKIPKNVSFIGGAAFAGCYNIEKFDVNELNPYFSVLDGVLFNKDRTKLVAFPCGSKQKHYHVPEGVKIIGDGSFLDSKIEAISFPSSLQIIEGWAFRFCENLKTLNIPNSVTEIGELAFEFCTKLEKVKLSNKLTILKQQTFSGSKNLKEIYVPGSVKIIENTAIGWSESLETIHLQDGLVEILDDLTNCKTLRNIVIPKTVKKVVPGIFRKNVAISEIKLDKENPYFCIFEGALYSKNMTNLTAMPYNEKKTIIIPNGVQEISDFVFEGFEKLEHIIFPNSLKIIGHRAFDNCISLKKVSLPKSLISIDFRAFDNCENLNVIEIYAKNPPEITNPSADCWKFIGDAKNLVMFVPEESISKYKKAFGWKDIKKIGILQKTKE